MDLAPLATSSVLIAIAELGDKTQIAVITLSSRFKASSVFFGAMLAFLLVTGIAVAIGDALSYVLPIFWMRITAASIFLVFGFYTVISRKKENFKAKGTQSSFLSSFSMITLMELGDKTQFAVIALSAEYKVPLMIYIGVIAAFILVTGLGVLIGTALTKFVSLKYIQLGSGILFVLLGIAFLVTTFTGQALPI